MKFNEFKNGLEDGKEFFVYLFEGEDAFFRERALTLLKNKFVQEPDLNYLVLGEEVELDRLLSSLNGFPFMSEKRLTAVREFYPKQDIFKKGLKEYLEKVKRNIKSQVRKCTCFVLYCIKKRPPFE